MVGFTFLNNNYCNLRMQLYFKKNVTWDATLHMQQTDPLHQGKLIETTFSEEFSWHHGLKLTFHCPIYTTKKRHV